MLVAPDKYILYSCAELATVAQGIAYQQLALEALITKAGSDAAGRFVSNQAYRPEYLSLRGQMYQLRKTAAEKNCNLPEAGGGVNFQQGEQIKR